MAETANIGVLPLQKRSQWVRLRTLIGLRWVAIAGQIVAITVSQAWFDLQMPIGLCFFAVGLAIIANLFSIFVYPENKRLSEQEAAGMLMFDIVQITLLLFFTGGLNNPFALLLLAPVTVSATALRVKSTIVLGATSAVLMSVLAFAYIPLVDTNGVVQQLPVLFRFGF